MSQEICKHSLDKIHSCYICCDVKIASLETRLAAYRKLKEAAKFYIEAPMADEIDYLDLKKAWDYALENIELLESEGK